jgi:hypothetical protein
MCVCVCVYGFVRTQQQLVLILFCARQSTASTTTSSFVDVVVETTSPHESTQQAPQPAVDQYFTPDIQEKQAAIKEVQSIVTLNRCVSVVVVVTQAFQHAWKNYETYAFGADEINPLSGAAVNNWGSLGVRVSSIHLRTAFSPFERPGNARRCTRHVTSIKCVFCFASALY